ncbi:hypothetical protein [Mesorhizobium shangrilense]|uniref:Carboxyltransferase domain-containing protein n=1 Tax=Mesorhizobium shangrilense TaxID=460060 RepID=A0ABV2DSH4_9HYPH
MAALSVFTTPDSLSWRKEVAVPAVPNGWQAAQRSVLIALSTIRTLAGPVRLTEVCLNRVLLIVRLIEANDCLGNRRRDAAIEIAYGRFALKASRPVTLAVTGAGAADDRYG